MAIDPIPPITAGIGFPVTSDAPIDIAPPKKPETIDDAFCVWVDTIGIWFPHWPENDATGRAKPVLKSVYIILPVSTSKSIL